MRSAALFVFLAATPLIGIDPPAKEARLIRPSVWWSGIKPVSDGGGRLDDKTNVLTDAESFVKFWQKSGMKGDPPQVNFRDHFVLVTFRALGLDFERGGLVIDDRGDAKAQGLRVHEDVMNSAYHSTTIAIFPRHGIKSIEGKKLPAVEE